MKKFLTLIILVLCCQTIFADDNPPRPAVQTPVTVSQNIMFENCSKIFAVNQEKLFYLTLASISANKFQIEEIASAGGYIIFTANRNKYLAAVAKVDNKNSILKITPCNNVYNFPPGILLNTFKYIDLNIGSLKEENKGK